MDSLSSQIPDTLTESLTRREREILALLADPTLSNQEIAGRLCLALASVKWFTHQIYAKLGVKYRRQAVVRARELGLLALTSVESSKLHNFPAELTSFIGREHEVEHLCRMLSGPGPRLLTLTGAGGVGKTRLALKVAEVIQENYPEGVWLVELASLNDPGLVDQTAGAAFNLTGGLSRPWIGTLQDYLSSKDLLLVLDNCEHLIEPCARLADALLKACPHLHILATSREALKIEGEIPYVVPSLAFPDPLNLPDLEQVTHYEAVRLFIERAHRVHAGFELTPSNAFSVARICQRLDGIPLALELAAARLKLLTITELESRLENAFQILTGGSRTALARYQTLRATVDWSYILLNEKERVLLRRLSVFSGGWTLEAAEAVCAEEQGLVQKKDILDLLTGLVDKSMVIALPGEGGEDQAGGETRYHLLETIRQYGREKLLEAGEGEALRRCHRDYFLKFAETNYPRLYYKEIPTWIRRYGADHENLLQALDWSFNDQENVESGPRLTAALMHFWHRRSFGPPHKYVPKAIDLCEKEAGVPQALLAQLLSWWPFTYGVTLDTHQSALVNAQRALDIARSLGPEGKETLCFCLGIRIVGVYEPDHHWNYLEALLDEREQVIQSLGSESAIDPQIYQAENEKMRGVLETFLAQYESAKAHLLESIRLYKKCSHEWSLIEPYYRLGVVHTLGGDYSQARCYFTEALTWAVEVDHVYQGSILSFLWALENLLENPGPALAFCQQYMRLAYRKATSPNIALCLEMAAKTFARRSRFELAARLSGAAEALSEKIDRKTFAPSPSAEGIVPFPESYLVLIPDWRWRSPDCSLEALVPGWPDRPDREEILKAWGEGRAMTYEQAVAFALGLEVE